MKPFSSKTAGKIFLVAASAVIALSGCAGQRAKINTTDVGVPCTADPADTDAFARCVEETLRVRAEGKNILFISQSDIKQAREAFYAHVPKDYSGGFENLTDEALNSGIEKMAALATPLSSPMTQKEKQTRFKEGINPFLFSIFSEQPFSSAPLDEKTGSIVVTETGADDNCVSSYIKSSQGLEEVVKEVLRKEEIPKIWDKGTQNGLRAFIHLHEVGHLRGKEFDERLKRSELANKIIKLRRRGRPLLAALYAAVLGEEKGVLKKEITADMRAAQDIITITKRPEIIEAVKHIRALLTYGAVGTHATQYALGRFLAEKTGKEDGYPFLDPKEAEKTANTARIAVSSGSLGVVPLGEVKDSLSETRAEMGAVVKRYEEGAISGDPELMKSIDSLARAVAYFTKKCPEMEKEFFPDGPPNKLNPKASSSLNITSPKRTPQACKIQSLDR